MKTTRPDPVPMKTVKAICALLCFTAAACSTTNEAGTRVGNPPTISTTEAFPESLAITSPLESGSEFTAGLSSLTLYAEDDGSSGTAYFVAASRISDILAGTTLTECAPLIEPLLNQDTDASCYGPTVKYENHPDFIPPAMPPMNMESGELPHGDVGLWTETEGENQACAAAQLNARMNAVKSKSQVALEVLASMKCVANVNEIELPATGSSVSLLDEMNEMAAANSLDVAFSTADLSASAAEERPLYDYDYDVAFTYTDPSGEPHDVVIRMTHAPLDEENATYKGRFSYTVGSVDSGMSNGCPEPLMTEAGSVLYNRPDATTLNFQALHASFCGEDAAPVQSDGLIHASDKFDMAGNPDGWVHAFSTATAEFDRTTGAGNYAFAWQAGTGDSNSRVFNLTLTDDDGLQGTAFFGFGDDVEIFDGSIKGFICNWAGPGASHVLQDYAQRQGITQVASSDVFLSVSDELNIGYAPTNSCDYDGTGAFTYDSDGSDAVDTDPAQVVANELLPLTDADTDGIYDEIQAAGFELPAVPENF